jgi:SAM-dependent methyltransferase
MNSDDISDKVFHFSANIFSYVPSSSWFYIRKLTSVTGARVLDVGCGEGDMARISAYKNNNYVIGADLHLPYLKINKKKKTYPDVVRCDARYLPFRAGCFDVVLCLEVMEHLNSKKIGYAVLDQFEKIAERRVIISTPVGYAWQGAVGGNEWQEHHLGWLSEDVTSLGYKVSYVGLAEGKLVKSIKNLIFKMVDSAFLKNTKTEKLGAIWSARMFDMLARVPYYLLGKLTFQSNESKFGHMICFKELNKQGSTFLHV